MQKYVLNARLVAARLSRKPDSGVLETDELNSRT
jgi:hypothetical protein